MKFISKEHQNQTLKVVRFCEYYDEKWILEEKVEFLLNENGKLKASYEILKNRFDALTKAVGRAN